jgi:hypothetical protein
MKKYLIYLLSSVLLFVSCKKDSEISSSPLEISDEVQVISERRCGTYEVFQAQLKSDPGLQKRMDAIELYTKKIQENPSLGTLVNGIMTIPVVVNVLYRTSAENISAAQIQSQIAVLNEDFGNTNADKTKVPSTFTDEQTAIGIKFTLAGVVRKATNKRSWGTNDAMKKSSQGGINPTSPTTTLNMWACNLGQGLLGYAQFPGGNSATDGVVILYSAFGSRAKAAGTYISKYDLGRTATHEVGHWVNLRHIWGDATCGNDYVGDTPTAHGANYGCPGTIAGCTSGQREMTMNYMDYTDDACMYMFTNGQKTRADAIFALGGARASFR